MQEYRVQTCMLVASLVLLGGCALETALPSRAVREFLPDSARQYVEFLASDDLQGRATPSPGLLRAATFIAEAFRRWGVEPIGESYWHSYTLVRRDLRRDSLVLRFRFGDTLWEAAIPQHAVPMPMTGAGRAVAAPLVVLSKLPADTVQLELVAPALRGSVILLTRLQRTEDTASRQGPSERISFWSWLRWMRQHGVVGVLLSDAPEPGQQPRPRRFPWPSLSGGGFVRGLPLQLPGLDTATPVVYSIGAEVLERVFGSVEVFRRFLEQQRASPEPVAEPIAGVRVELALAFQELEHIEVPNVVGILRGRSRPHEYVLIGAHYDHVGVMARAAAGTDSIYNGADDNASGTAGLLLIARALAQLPKPPSRSVVFVAFSGEERGLLGSYAFVQSPPLPLEHCVAMLNMDMIGRNHPDSLSVGFRGQWLEPILQEQNRALPRPFLLGHQAEEFFGRSDHASFAARGIPVLFFFTGLHEDYHRPSDHAEKLNYEKLSRVALLAARVAWVLATLPAVPPAL